MIERGLQLHRADVGIEFVTDLVVDFNRSRAAGINDIQNPALTVYHQRQRGTPVVAAAGRDAGYRALVN